MVAAQSLKFLEGDDKFKKLFREVKWDQTEIGPLENWPPALRTAVSMIINSQFPMFISWGQERTFLYNEAYSVILGKKHPQALGEKFNKIWAEIWNDIYPLIAKVDQGESVYLKDLRLIVNRTGKDEEAFFTFSYSPILDDAGRVQGLYCAVVETTSEVQALTKLSQNQKRLQVALSTGRMGSWDIDLKTGEAILSSDFAKVFGFGGEFKNVDLVIEKSIHPDDQERARQNLKLAVEQNKPYTDEYRIVKPDDGSIRWIHTRGSATYDENGVPTFLSGVVIDITDRKMADLALRLEREKLRAIFYGSDTGMVLFRGKDLVFEMANQSYLKLIPGRDVLGKKLADALPEVSDSEFPRVIQKVYETGEPARLLEGKTPLFNTQSGQLEDRYFDTTFARISDLSDGELLVVGQVMDVTERVLSKNQIEVAKLEAERERAKFEAAFHAVAEGIFIFDSNGQPIFMNEGAAKVFGSSKASDVTKDFAFFFERLDLYEMDGTYIPIEEWPVSKVLRGESFRDWQIIAHRRDINRRWIWSSSGELAIQAGSNITLAVVVLRDISEQKTAEKELIEAKLEAERANQLKSSFLANMSHEIRTPLAAILGFSSLLKDRDLIDNERDHYIETVARNGKALTRIIDDILDLAKVEAGKLDIENIELSLLQLFAESVELFRDKAKQKGISLSLSVDDSVPAHIKSDPTRLRQILVNLIGNAVKFTEVGGIRIYISSKKIDEQKVKIVVEVIDSGVGLSEEQQKKLFQPFTQADDTTTRKFGGTGLGLVLSQRLAQALNGNITIKTSTLGEGSNFEFTFETTVTQSALQKDLNKGKSSSMQSLEGVRVLIVDDSPDNQFLARRLLVKQGAKVSVASDGHEALESIHTDTFDIVLMDLQMPNMDGYQAKSALDRRGFKKPVIALTAHAMVEEKRKTTQAGFIDHLTKPIIADELIKSILKNI